VIRSASAQAGATRRQGWLLKHAFSHGMAPSKMRGMATMKITVTVPEELVAHIRREIEQGRYASISAFVTQALESMRDFEPLDLLIASMIAETGQPDEAAQVWVEQAMATARKARLSEGGRNAQEVA
jgi:Arc/MetJ-type ribon-helix-helix transcriptional regulator